MIFYFFFFKQKTAYEMRISDWSSDVCSSDLAGVTISSSASPPLIRSARFDITRISMPPLLLLPLGGELLPQAATRTASTDNTMIFSDRNVDMEPPRAALSRAPDYLHARQATTRCPCIGPRSEEHTSELQSLMRISYAVFC